MQFRLLRIFRYCERGSQKSVSLNDMDSKRVLDLFNFLFSTNLLTIAKSTI
jgi:hypothetical protein